MGRRVNQTALAIRTERGALLSTAEAASFISTLAECVLARHRRRMRGKEVSHAADSGNGSEDLQASTARIGRTERTTP